MRILLADDHAVVRRGVRELLADSLVAEFGEAQTGAEAVQLALTESWDLVVIDLAMPGGGGIEAIKQIRADKPTLAIVVLTGHADPEYAVRSLRAGANAYVTKEAAPEELMRAATKALAGESYVCDALAQRLAAVVALPADRPRHAALSDRELQVLRMLGAGKSVKQIGIDLTLSEKTVSTYRARLLDKMGMETNADLVRYALQVGLVD